MTKEQKIERVIKWLTTSHLDCCHGGYPHDYTTYKGMLFVATLDDGKERARTQIDRYRLDDIAKWYNIALGFLEENDMIQPDWPEDGMSFHSDWHEAFHETESAAIRKEV